MISSDETLCDTRLSDVSALSAEVTECQKSASKALQEYIEQFEGERTPKRTRNGCYASSTVSSLLSSKPKAASSPRTLQSSHEISEDMVDNLIAWVNASYSKDLHRKIVPYGAGSSISSIEKLHLSDLEEPDIDSDGRSVWSDSGAELSTLPSPGESVVSGIDSNDGSVSTDLLVHSFYKKSGVPAPVNRNYPSWVEDLTTQGNYPSWIDEINETQVTVRNQRSRLSRSLSPSFFRQHADLQHSPPSFLSTSLQDNVWENVKASRMSKRDVWELESTDTDVLMSQPMYGKHPVNMGGSLHSSLYRDKKIQKLLDESMRKVVTRTQRPAAKHTSTTKLRPEGILRTSEHLHGKEKSAPRQAGDFSKISPKRSNAVSNIELIVEERRTSEDSGNTDHLMRQSPTGIHMVKRVGTTPLRAQGRTSTSVESGSKQIFSASGIHNFGRNASEELARRIALAEAPLEGHKTPSKDSGRKSVRKGHDIAQTSGGRSFSGASRGAVHWKEEAWINGSRRDNYRSKNPRSDDPGRDSPPENGTHSDALRINKLGRDNLRRCDARRDAKTRTVPGRNEPWEYQSQRNAPWVTERAKKESRRNDPRRYEHRKSEPRKSDPRKNIPRGNEHQESAPRRLLSGARTVPRLRSTSVPEMTADGLRQSLITALRRDRTHPVYLGHEKDIFSPRLPVDSLRNRLNSVATRDEEIDSLNTETLVVHPPMPLFDASPSLTTETTSTVGSDDDPDTSLEQQALKTSVLLENSDLGSSSGTSFMELMRSRAQPSALKMNESQRRWEQPLFYDTKTRISPKPGIITSFLEDCMKSGEESHLEERSLASASREESANDGSERPVETLKKMLFTVQNLAQQNEDGENTDHDKIEQNYETKSETPTEDYLSDAFSNEMPIGNSSLSRAYYHLTRLKKLVSVSQRVAGLT